MQVGADKPAGSQTGQQSYMDPMRRLELQLLALVALFALAVCGYWFSQASINLLRLQ